MSTYISNRELEELGEGLTRHYLENAHIHMAARCIDIEGLANYLGMTVVFETFAEEDRDKVGFLVRIIPVTQTDIVFVKCRKCKFDGALSPAYFRRIRNCRVNRMQWEEL